MRCNWFAPLTTKRDKQGILRSILKAAGPTWAASPVRRIVQCLCFIAFLWLFCFVCWPYTARPPRTWQNWLPLKIDAEQGQVVLANELATDVRFVAGMRFHASDPSLGDDGYLGEFEVRSFGTSQLELRLAAKPSREQVDAIASSAGPWSLAERKPGGWPSHYADSLSRKKHIPAETFLILDPLVSISTAIASRSWVWSLVAAGAILLVCVLIPRGFCGYLCPLGTLIDLFDWLIGRRVRRFRVTNVGLWGFIRYCLLAAVLGAAICGVLVSGFVAAIPIITRAAAFLLTPLQTGLARDWHQIPPWHAGQFVSLAMFGLVLVLGFLQPRFWCKYVCPTGAVFSLGNCLRATQRQVLTTCIDCGKCVAICPFDAIAADFTTKTSNCTFCQTCGGVCPAGAIQFVGRREQAEWKGSTPQQVIEGSPARRDFLTRVAVVLGGAFTGAGSAFTLGRIANGQSSSQSRIVVRPPGSVPEREFLQLCVRCGECYQACPNNVLQPVSFELGFDGLWTPRVVADWSGCEPSCSNCGRVCPTGAIRALPLEEKRAARIGLAVVNQKTCLPFAGKEPCELCVKECRTAGYHAIEFQRVGTELDAQGQPIEGSGFLAPTVRADLCVGCGLCQTRCNRINVQSNKLLSASAIIVQAGPGKEDRLRTGSYIAQRESEKQRRDAPLREGTKDNSGGYLPDFLK